MSNGVRLSSTKWHRKWATWVIVLAQLLFGLTLQAVVAPSAHAGTCTSAFPSDSQWKPVRDLKGGLLTDPINDVGSGSDSTSVDIYGTEATSSTPAGSAIDWYSNGSSGCFQFRMRVAASAISGSRINNNQWIVGLGTGSTTNAWMIVDGDNKDPNAVRIFDGSATPVEKFTYNFNGLGSNTTYAFATSIGSGASIRYYVYWQVPYADLISVLGSSTIYGFFAGTSQANSFSSINRDCLSATCTSASYTTTQKVDLSQNVSAAVAPPNITSLSITKGTTAGGTTSIVISGTNLTNTVRVLFGTAPATITANNSTSVTVTSPPGSVGNENIQVETAAGGLSNILQGAYKYITVPTVSTIAATGLSSTTAQLNATVNAGNDPTSTSFCWGTSNTLSGCTSVSGPSLSGTSTTPISYGLTNLTNSTTYYYRAIGTNSLGTTNGSILSFTTAAAALSITSTSPLNAGQVGVPYSVKLAATGGTGSYTSWTKTSGSLPNGLTLGSNGIISGTPTATGTSSAITIQVTDSAGTTATKTFDLTINAGPPFASTLTATGISQTAATLNGNVNDNGASTTVSWCMSTDAAVDANGGLLSCTQIAVTASPSSVTASTGFTAITGSASGLSDLTTYYFQVKAVNSAGTTYGDISSFQTSNKSNQATLTATLSPTSKAYPYSQVLNNSTSGGSTSGTVTYTVVPGGTAKDCLLSDSSATATLTASTSGTCLIVATMAGNASYNSVTSASKTFTFSKATLTVTADNISVGYGSSSPSYTFTYSGFVNSETSSSIEFTTGLVDPSCTSSYTSSTAISSSPLTISCSGGSANNYTFSYATGQLTITTGTQASLTISTLGGSSKTYPYSQALSASTTGGSGNGAVTYAIQSGGTATSCALSNSSSTATLTATTSGTCLIVATKASDGNYNSISSAAATFTFNKAAQTASWSVISTTDNVGKSYNLSTSPAASGSGGGTITYAVSSAGTAGCSVSGTNGVNLAWTSAGTCTLTATAGSNTNYEASTAASQTFTISAAAPTITGISPSTGTYAGGTTVTITGTNLTGTTAVTFDGSSGTSVTVVSATSVTVVTPAHAIGAVNVVLTAPGGAVTSTNGFTYVAFVPTATSSSASSIGSTSATLNGSVTANGASTTITFCLSTSSSTSGGALTCASTPTASTTSTSGTQAVTAASGTLTAGTTYYYQVVGSNSVGTTYGSVISFTTLKVTTTTLADGTVGTSGYSQTLAATGGTGTYGTWTVASGTLPAGLTLNSSTGAITGTPTTAGTSSFTITTASGGLTSSAASLSIVIGQASTTTSIALPSSVTTATYGSPVTITATVSQAGTVNFKLGGTSISSCDAKATSGSSPITATCSWTPASTGALVLTATLTPTSGNYSASTSSNLTVYVNTVSFTSSASATTVGKNLTLTATVSPSSATGTVVFKDASSNTLCTTSSLSGGTASCVWTTASAGTFVVHAEYSGDGSYAASQSSTTTLTVNSLQGISGGGNISTTYGTAASTSSFTSTNGTGSKTWSIALTAGGSVTGVSIDSSSGVVTASALTPYGTYAMTVTVTDSVSSTATTTMSIEVGKATLTVTANAQSVTYGDAAPTYTKTITGYKNSEDASVLTTVPTCTSSYSASTHVISSPVAITCSGGVASNYTFSYVSGAVTIAKANQATLSVSTTSGSVGSSLTLGTSGGSGNGSVTYTVANGTATCTYSAGSLSVAAAGTCLVGATKAESADYLSATSAQATVTFDNKLAQTLTFTTVGFTPSTAISKTYGDPTFSVVATADHSGDGGVITYTSYDLDICSVDSSSGLVTIISAGECEIGASITAGTSYGAASTSTLTVVTIAKKTLSISGSSIANKVYNGSSTVGTITVGTATGYVGTETVVITASGSNYSGSNVGTYSSTITYSLADGTNGGKAANYQLAAESLSGGITQASTTSAISASASATTKSKSITLYVTVSPSSATGTVVFKDAGGTTLCTTGSLNAGSASCSWTNSAPGTYVIHSEYAGDTNYSGSNSTTTSVLVNDEISIAGGGNLTTSYLSAASTSAFTASNGTGTKTWAIAKSGGGSVSGVTIDASTGIVTAASGTVVGIYSMTITATDAVGATKTATMTVTVSKIDPSLSWTDVTKSISQGTFTLTDPTSSTPGTFVFTSGSTSVATISGNVVTLKVAGTSTITATFTPADLDNYNSPKTVTMVLTITSLSDPTLALVYPGSNTSTLTVNGTVTPSTNTNSGNGTVTYSTSSSACSVNSSTGVITMLTIGNCVIVMNSSSTSTYNAATISVTFVITSASLIDQTSPLVLTISPTSKIYTYTQSISMSTSGGSGSGAVTYSITSGGTATGCTLSATSSPATVSATTSGTCLVIATKAADSTYNSATSASVTFTFILGTQTVSFTQPSAMTVGDADQSLTYSATSGLTVTLTSNTTGVCTIVSNKARAIAAGTCSITASQGGNDNYSAASSVTRTFTISAASTPPPSSGGKEDPELNWSDPSPIYSGTALSSSQLNASASVSGTYSYSPSAGTILSPGTYTLYVTFTPSNRTRYNSVSTAVTITIRERVTPVATPTPTPSPSNNGNGNSNKPTPTPTPTPTPKPTPTPTPTINPIAKGVVTNAGQTVVAVVLNVSSSGVVKSTTTTSMPTPTQTPSVTPTPTPTPTPSPSPSNNGNKPTPAPSPSASAEPTPTPSPTPSNNGNKPTPTPSPTPSASAESTPTPSPSPSASNNGNRPTPTPTPSPSASAEPTPTPSPTQSNNGNRPTPSPSPSPSASSEPTPTPSATNNGNRPTPTPTPSPSASASSTPRPSTTPSATPTPSTTPRPTTTPSATPSPTPKPSVTPSPSATPTSTPTPIPTPTVTAATVAEVTRPVGEGISRVSVIGTKVSVTPAKTFSGVTSVAVNVRQDGQTKEVIIPVTVLPEAPKAPIFIPKTINEAVISWKLSPNASSYDVYVKGQLVCQTSASSCTAPVTVGPKTPVQIVANGGDKLTAVTTPAYQPVKPVPAITVNFATGSSKLSAAQKVELNKVAKTIVEEGFVRLVVYGYTDSRGGVDNQALSVARAQATADYLAKLAPGVDFVVSGFGASKPVASNSTADGMAANRRAELSLW